MDKIRQQREGLWQHQDNCKSFSKAILIQEMIRSMKFRGDGLCRFGNDYVEIKNVKDVSRIAVGVATKSTKCRELGEPKRERLARVGADYIIPNLRCRDKLLEILFPE